METPPSVLRDGEKTKALFTVSSVHTGGRRQGGWGGVWGMGGGVALSAGSPVTEKNVEKLREAESIWSPSPGADRESISAHSLGGDST